MTRNPYKLITATLKLQTDRTITISEMKFLQSLLTHSNNDTGLTSYKYQKDGRQLTGHHSMTKIGDAAGISQANSSRVVKSLREKELVTKISNSHSKGLAAVLQMNDDKILSMADGEAPTTQTATKQTDPEPTPDPQPAAVKPSSLAIDDEIDFGPDPLGDWQIDQEQTEPTEADNPLDLDPDAEF